MRLLEFNTLLENIYENCRGTLEVKAGDYAQEQDRLWNFKAQGNALSISPRQVALVLLMKHITGIINFCQKPITSFTWRDSNGFEGPKQRFADAINYLFLLAALCQEEADVQFTEKPGVTIREDNAGESPC